MFACVECGTTQNPCHCKVGAVGERGARPRARRGPPRQAPGAARSRSRARCFSPRSRRHAAERCGRWCRAPSRPQGPAFPPIPPPAVATPPLATRAERAHSAAPLSPCAPLSRPLAPLAPPAPGRRPDARLCAGRRRRRRLGARRRGGLRLLALHGAPLDGRGRAHLPPRRSRSADMSGPIADSRRGAALRTVTRRNERIARRAAWGPAGHTPGPRAPAPFGCRMSGRLRFAAAGAHLPPRRAGLMLRGFAAATRRRARKDLNAPRAILAPTPGGARKRFTPASAI
jgi:hypothetical protein